MVTVRTELNNTKESARLERFEPTALNGATDVQHAIQNSVPLVGSARQPAFGSTINIIATDVEVGINTSTGAVSCPLPSVASWLAVNPNGLELTIFDLTGNAATHNVTPVLNGTDTFLQGVTPVINAAFGLIKLRPVLGAPDSWYVRGHD